MKEDMRKLMEAVDPLFEGDVVGMDDYKKAQQGKEAARDIMGIEYPSEDEWARRDFFDRINKDPKDTDVSEIKKWIAADTNPDEEYLIQRAIRNL